MNKTLNVVFYDKEKWGEEFSTEDLLIGIVINENVKSIYGVNKNTLKVEDLRTSPYVINIGHVYTLLCWDVLNTYSLIALYDENNELYYTVNSKTDMLLSDPFAIFSKSGEFLYCAWDKKFGNYKRVVFTLTDREKGIKHNFFSMLREELF